MEKCKLLNPRSARYAWGLPFKLDHENLIGNFFVFENFNYRKGP
jgi:hypothetical protein